MAGPRLIDLRTDLKSLRYGSDKPYITKDINNPPSSNQTGMQITKRVDDLSRIAQMLIDRPGLKFIGNQALLQQTDSVEKLQKASQGGIGAVGREALQIAKNTIIGTAKIIGSTLAQVPVNGTGTHFVYGFRTDTYLSPATTNSFTQFFGAGGVEGAPLALRGEVVPVSRLETTPEGTQLAETTAKPEQLGQLHIGIKGDITPLEQPVIKPFREEDQKKKAKNNTKDNITNALTGSAITLSGAVETTATPGVTEPQNLILGSISNTDVTGSYGPNSPNIGVEQPKTSTHTEGSGSYISKQKTRGTKNQNVLKEQRVRLGDQGARKDDAKRKNQYWTVTDGKAEVDKINAQEIVATKIDGETGGRDLVKFRFHVITPSETQILYFRAFIDSFSDSYTGQWNPIKYLGRAEDFQVYGGFQRKISLSFKIAAASRSEMKPLYQKMIYLASSTAPTYTNEGQFMRGSIVKMTIGDYVYELPGIMNSVTYNWNVEYPWEIAMLEPEGTNDGDKEMQELPMIMDCSIDFTPIHTFTPETGLKKYITAGTNGTNSFI
jgi:hypothetical protein